MILEFKDYIFSDDTKTSDENTTFVKTHQNEKYITNSLICKEIIEPKKLLELLDLQEMQIIGITGTNGKTTTAFGLSFLLNSLGFKSATQGTRGAFLEDLQLSLKSLTTPSFLQTVTNMLEAKKKKARFFVMEVSSHAIEQKRIEDLNFALKIFTNLSQDHLDFHGDMENYAKVKSSFFADECLKLINADDKHLTFNATNSKTYGVKNKADFCIKNYNLLKGIKAKLSCEHADMDFSSPMEGFFNLYNLTCAISAVCMLVDANEKELKKAISSFHGVSGRMEKISHNVIVDFAHTPDGIEKVCSSLAHKKLSVVFGAGGDRDKTKRPIMLQTALKYAQNIIITSDNPRSEDPENIILDILDGKTYKNVEVQVDRKKAIAQALKKLKDDEILLILGKGDEDYQEIKGVKYPFDDRLIAKELLSK